MTKVNETQAQARALRTALIRLGFTNVWVGGISMQEIHGMPDHGRMRLHPSTESPDCAFINIKRDAVDFFGRIEQTFYPKSTEEAFDLIVEWLETMTGQPANWEKK